MLLKPKINSNNFIIASVVNGNVKIKNKTTENTNNLILSVSLILLYYLIFLTN